MSNLSMILVLLFVAGPVLAKPMKSPPKSPVKSPAIPAIAPKLGNDAEAVRKKYPMAGLTDCFSNAGFIAHTHSASHIVSIHEEGIEEWGAPIVVLGGRTRVDPITKASIPYVQVLTSTGVREYAPQSVGNFAFTTHLDPRPKTKEELAKGKPDTQAVEKPWLMVSLNNQRASFPSGHSMRPWIPMEIQQDKQAPLPNLDGWEVLHDRAVHQAKATTPEADTPALRSDLLGVAKQWFDQFPNWLKNEQSLLKSFDPPSGANYLKMFLPKQKELAAVERQLIDAFQREIVNVVKSKDGMISEISVSSPIQGRGPVVSVKNVSKGGWIREAGQWQFHVDPMQFTGEKSENLSHLSDPQALRNLGINPDLVEKLAPALERLRPLMERYQNLNYEFDNPESFKIKVEEELRLGNPWTFLGSLALCEETLKHLEDPGIAETRASIMTAKDRIVRDFSSEFKNIEMREQFIQNYKFESDPTVKRLYVRIFEWLGIKPSGDQPNSGNSNDSNPGR